MSFLYQQIAISCETNVTHLLNLITPENSRCGKQKTKNKHRTSGFFFFVCIFSNSQVKHENFTVHEVDL